MSASLTLVKRRLPPSWDGWLVQWDKYEDSPAIHMCPPPEPTRCGCGSDSTPRIARGLRMPKPGETVETTTQKTGRFGRVIHRPATVPANPVIDLMANRCPDCGSVDVWDMRANEWWTLDDDDYGPDGSNKPIEHEWSGGLFDLLHQ